MAPPEKDPSIPSPTIALAPLRFLYAVYAIATFLVLGLLTLLALLLIPGLRRRRAVAKACARSFLRLAGMPVTVRGIEQIPPTQCVIVSNHASYLDGVVYTGILPPRFGFVIKREMNNVPMAGMLLRRLGSEFVERFNRYRGAADTRRVLRTATNGNSLVFFPEGTFTPAPGLLKFHTGAFVVAARAGCPVVPAVVRGSRIAMSPRTGMPQPNPIRIQFLQPITAAATSSEKAAIELRDRARAAILQELGEPDLTCSDDTDRPRDKALG